MVRLLMALQVAALDPGGPVPVHDALHYRIEVTLPDSGTTITGVVKTQWRLEGSAPLRIDLDTTMQVTTQWRLEGSAPLRIDLDTTMQVTRATINDSRDVIWDRDDNAIVIHHGGERGDSLATTLYYRGAPVDGLVIRGNPLTGRTYFSDNWPNRARRWFPGHDHPADKASVDIIVEAPPALMVIANGNLVQVDTLPSGRVRWSSNQPEPIPTYTMVIGAARFSVATLPPAACAHRCVPQSVWLYPADSAQAMAGPFRRTTSMVDFFSSLLGPFPYQRLDHVQATTIFGGMENVSAIFYSAEAISERRLSEETVAHEVAHQWFGDAVTPREWQDLWLSEGFATYLAMLWRGHADGSEAFFQSLDHARASVVTSQVAGAAIVADTAPRNLLALLNNNTYHKGAWALHSLRGVVGDSAFFAGLRTYYQRFQHRNATTADFVGVMESASGQDLDWYFEQSLRVPGYPRLYADWTHEAETRSLVLTVTQQQRGTLFRLPGLEVEVDGRVVHMDVEGPETSVTLADVAAPPRRVIIDPRVWWLLERHVRE
jgi:aminopeptidase N